MSKKQQQPQKNFVKRKLNDNFNGPAEASLGLIGRGMAKTKDYYSQNANLNGFNFEN